MFLVISAGFCSISLVLLLVLVIYRINEKTSVIKREVVISSRPARTNVMIICGNCAGDSALPYKTFMNINGYCETCGSASYILASLRGLLHYRVRGMRLRAVSTPPRVLAFEKRRTA